jgi:hypothetical protein
MGMIFQLQVAGFGNPAIQRVPHVMPPRKSVSIYINLAFLPCLLTGREDPHYLKNNRNIQSKPDPL